MTVRPRRGSRVGVGSASAALRRALRLTPAIPSRSKCWGLNQNAQLGLGDTVNRGRLADSMGANLPSVDLGAWTAVEVAAGERHTCARLENGTARALKCWGSNYYGQLGLGDSDLRGGDGGGDMGDSLPAVQLGTNRSAVGLALGRDSSCVLLDNGLVKCWGRNYYGQLGLGDSDSRGDGGGEMGDSLPSVPIAPLCLGPCPAGYLGPYGGPCIPCDAGKYKVASGAGETGHCSYCPWRIGECSTCPPGTSSASGSNELTDCKCVAGYNGTSDGEQCTACEAGGYKVTAGTGSCSACPSHTSSAEGGDELTDCQCVLGYTAASDGMACEACEAGTFKGAAGTAACETCPAHAESSSGSVLCQCSGGFTGADGGPCSACLAGEYKATAGSGICTECPSQTSSAEGSDALVDCKCVPGSTAASDGSTSSNSSNGVACSACDSGTYKVASGTGECSTCPPGTSSASGSNELTDCKFMAGYNGTSDGEQCTACEAGGYKVTAGTGGCSACPSHTSSAEESDELTDCQCVPGYTAASDDRSLLQCSACDTGTYKPLTGAGECSTCPVGTSSASGSNSSTDCKCMAGYTGTSDGAACTACEKGAFKSATGTGQCSTCPSNLESGAGSALCRCSAGFTGADGGPCTACVVAEYKAAAGPGSCAPCPSQTSSAEGSDELGDCACVPGYPQPSTLNPEP